MTHRLVQSFSTYLLEAFSVPAELLTVGAARPTNLWVKIWLSGKPEKWTILKTQFSGYHTKVTSVIILMTLEKIFYILLYIFLLAEKKKIAGSQMFASLKQYHFHPGIASVLIPEVEE